MDILTADTSIHEGNIQTFRGKDPEPLIPKK